MNRPILIEALQAGNQSGTGTYAARLIAELAALAREQALPPLHATWPAEIPTPEETGETVTWWRLPVRRSPARRAMLTAVAVPAIAMRIGAGLIHYTTGAGPLCRLPGGIRAVATIHDIAFLHDPAWQSRIRCAYLRATVSRAARVADRIFTDSAPAAADIIKRLDIDPARVEVIPLGIDPPGCVSEQARRETLARYGLPDRFVLHLGALEPRKNLIRLLYAYARAESVCPWDLVIAGRPGWRAEETIHAARALPCAHRIHLPGYIAAPDLDAILASAAVFAGTSLWEGFGLALAQAMAHGIPTITSDRSGLLETAANTGIRVDPEDTDAIASALRRFSSDAPLRTRLAALSRARAAWFTWRATAERTLHGYRAVLEG